MGTGVDADRGTGSAAKAREPGVALLFRRASALAFVGMAAFTDIVITRRRAGWPVRRVSMRSRLTRQSPTYAPCDAFADGSARFYRFGKTFSPVNMWAVDLDVRNIGLTVP